MKDLQLYNLIKKVVREKKKVPNHPETQNFAQRFCTDKLNRKIYNNRSHQKMGMLMKNFNKLETYFDLPELVKQIRMTKSRQIEQNRMKSLRSIKKIEFSTEIQSVQKNTQGKSYSHLKNLRSSIENQYTKVLLDSIQSNNIWKSQTLKNNSIYHMSNVQDSLKKWKEKDSQNQNKKLFGDLQSFLKNEKNERIKQNKIQLEEKKEVTEFLHKVSSYLQIILQKQHKSKWKRKRSSSIFKPKNLDLVKNCKSHYFNQKTNKKTSLITYELSNKKFLQTLKEQTGILKQFPQMPEKQKYLIKRPNYRLYTQLPIQKQKVKKPSSRFKQQSINISCQVSNERPGFIRKQSDIIKQNFTFRRRSIKQKIIKKLDKFIDQIDDQTISNKKENGYYNNEIDKLQKNMKKLYNRYRKETIADEKQIENLKRLAQEFSVSTPNRRTPESASSYASQKKIENELWER